MRHAILMAAILLAACGSKPGTTVVAKDGTTVTTGGDGGVTVHTDKATLTAGNAACANKPAFVPVYAGGSTVTCVVGDERTGKTGGMMVYKVAAAPATVLAWSKEEAAKAGLAARIQTETMLSAGEANKRTLVVMVAAENAGTQATVTWGVEN